MSIGLLFDHDELIISNFCAAHKLPRFSYDRVIGIVNKEGAAVIGCIVFQNWNGHNIELSYYSRNTLTPGMVRLIARYTLEKFDVSRVTMTISKKRRRLLRSLQKFGFRLEGTQRRYFGKIDCSRNVAIRLVMFRETIEQLAKLESHEAA